MAGEEDFSVLNAIENNDPELYEKIAKFAASKEYLWPPLKKDENRILNEYGEYMRTIPPKRPNLPPREKGESNNAYVSRILKLGYTASNIPPAAAAPATAVAAPAPVPAPVEEYNMGMNPANSVTSPTAAPRGAHDIIANAVTAAAAVGLPTHAETAETPLDNLEKYKLIQRLLRSLYTEGSKSSNTISLSTHRVNRTIRQRNTRRGWFGPKESQSTYAKYLREVLEKKRVEVLIQLYKVKKKIDIDPVIEILGLLNKTPPPRSADIFMRFNTWRTRLLSAGSDETAALTPELRAKLQAIRSPGFFTSRKTYQANIQRVLLQYVSTIVGVDPPVEGPSSLRGGARQTRKIASRRRRAATRKVERRRRPATKKRRRV